MDTSGLNLSDMGTMNHGGRPGGDLGAFAPSDRDGVPQKGGPMGGQGSAAPDGGRQTARVP